MRILAIIAAVAITAASVSSCGSGSSAPKTFCDSACLKDTLKFTGTHKLKPTVFISASNCKPDTIIWSYDGLESSRKTKFEIPAGVIINKDFVRCLFNENKYAYILYNDCGTGRGFQMKLPYDKAENFVMKSSGINNMDKKFSVADNLVVNTDRGNIYVEDMNTGKKAMMTFGQKVDIDYDAIHEHVDSVNVTDTRIWVKVKIGDKWEVKEKSIVLE